MFRTDQIRNSYPSRCRGDNGISICTFDATASSVGSISNSILLDTTQGCCLKKQNKQKNVYENTRVRNKMVV